MSDSLQPHGPYSPWNSPGQNTGVGSLSLLQGIFPTQGSNPGLLHCRQELSHQGRPRILEWVAYPFSRGSSRPRNRTEVSCMAGGFFTRWATREALWFLYLSSLTMSKAKIMSFNVLWLQIWQSQVLIMDAEVAYPLYLNYFYSNNMNYLWIYISRWKTLFKKRHFFLRNIMDCALWHRRKEIWLSGKKLWIPDFSC